MLTYQRPYIDMVAVVDLYGNLLKKKGGSAID